MMFEINGAVELLLVQPTVTEPVVITKAPLSSHICHIHIQYIIVIAPGAFGPGGVALSQPSVSSSCFQVAHRLCVISVDTRPRAVSLF